MSQISSPKKASQKSANPNRANAFTSKALLSQTLYQLSPPTYQLCDRIRQKMRPWVESAAQKHQRERRTADYLLLSLTNCGRTWLRVMIGRTMQLHYNQHSHLSEINLHDLFRFSEAVPLLPAIKPMHEKYGQFGHSYTGQKVILLVRDPRDAIVSRYHQHKDSLAFDRTFGSLENYVTESEDLLAYIQFYNDWQTHRDTAESLLVVRYEDMKADTCREVSRVFDFLQVAVNSDKVQQAVEYASFKNMRKMELEGSQQVRAGVMSSRDVNDPASYKVRKGAIGGYKSELSPTALSRLDHLVQSQLHPIYGYG